MIEPQPKKVAPFEIFNSTINFLILIVLAFSLGISALVYKIIIDQHEMAKTQGEQISKFAQLADQTAKRLALHLTPIIRPLKDTGLILWSCPPDLSRMTRTSFILENVGGLHGKAKEIKIRIQYQSNPKWHESKTVIILPELQLGPGKESDFDDSFRTDFVDEINQMIRALKPRAGLRVAGIEMAVIYNDLHGNHGAIDQIKWWPFDIGPESHSAKECE